THTWVSASFAALFDEFAGHFGDWRRSPTLLEKAVDLKGDERFRRGMWQAHQTNKKNLCDFLKGWRMDPNVFTIAWARRIAAYKRPSLILQDVDSILDIARRV